MGTATGASYFQRGSLFWFTVIAVSFSYYTVMPANRRQAPRKRTGQSGLSLGNRLVRLFLRGPGREAILAQRFSV